MRSTRSFQPRVWTMRAWVAAENPVVRQMATSRDRMAWLTTKASTRARNITNALITPWMPYASSPHTAPRSGFDCRIADVCWAAFVESVPAY